MRAPALAFSGLARQLARLARNQSGAALVEFTIVALPFFILLFGIAEIGLVYWGNKELENATNDAARMVRTGQVQNGAMSAAALKALACSRTALLVDCNARLRLDVRSAAQFGDIVPPEPRNADGRLKDDDDFSYAPGSADEVALITAYYEWPGFFQGPYLLQAAAPVRNEPF